MPSPPNTPTKSKWKDVIDEHHNPSHETTIRLMALIFRWLGRWLASPTSKALISRG
eukprot:CAMPEP_0201889262 /NCGR_PEP_ID=MMETSP0902-20130614/29579_1 /ASSEMBLY_ACC=CAM_ASM_000551 /TAXON_ID=420261 /ORGANISM="Thalassiosira antarctica, Strain CCMP982" /LENGTH=55 /DNA_ID=CAMNT_0048419785 /DNA_START=275 /DNA_END=438 /DNA_ORIENTATION=-